MITCYRDCKEYMDDEHLLEHKITAYTQEVVPKRNQLTLASPNDGLICNSSSLAHHLTHTSSKVYSDWIRIRGSLMIICWWFAILSGFVWTAIQHTINRTVNRTVKICIQCPKHTCTRCDNVVTHLRSKLSPGCPVRPVLELHKYNSTK